MGLDFTILLIGLNHNTAPVEIREKLSFKDSLVFPLEKLKNEGLNFKEAYFLSTCNRVEFCFVLAKGQKEAFLEDLFSFFEKEVGFKKEEIKKHFYRFEDEEAVRHLFEVACGLDSLVLGEPQILGQVKEAYQKALFYKTSGIVLNRLLHRCFFVAKRVRTETGIGGGAVSISYAACELAKKILGSLKQKVVLLVGAGEMAELACMHFISSGVQKVLIANRTISKAVELAERFKGEAYSLEELPYVLTKADVVISSTGAPSFVITKQMVSSVLKPRKFRPLFIIDIAVPRDVDPEVNQLENVYVYNIDDLKEVVEENFQERKKEALRAKVIIEEEVFKFKKWLKEIDFHPTIRALSQKFEQIKQKELAKTLKKLKNLSEEEKRHLEVLTQSLVQKILYYPINFIKKDHHDKGAKAIGLIRQMFELDNLNLEPQIKKPETISEKLNLSEKDFTDKESNDTRDPSKKVLLQ
ncbi:glutamyl-tRNA reductase [Thermodesulfobacterium sp. TA1]|uniref:glutamyl-tRNA reductase n=1 Tax=Thermodesulfobacterium sp. TA1 TaxID=2234087 RepID=UPI0012320C49|nr:glutamyl-tRNA reductase [Thermodesulfobacterium sp. TA1]QER41231.1 glutamyl-tRNA reductase [Thermodesulfobacterium sp. TA1]